MGASTARGPGTHHLSCCSVKDGGKTNTGQHVPPIHFANHHDIVAFCQPQVKGLRPSQMPFLHPLLEDSKVVQGTGSKLGVYPPMLALLWPCLAKNRAKTKRSRLPHRQKMAMISLNWLTCSRMSRMIVSLSNLQYARAMAHKGPKVGLFDLQHPQRFGFILG